MKTKQIKRGDIYMADLGEGTGSEQSGKRPVAIIQNDKGNSYSPTTIIAPFTTKTSVKRRIPTHVYFEKAGELSQPSILLLEQIRTIDKLRLSESLGAIEEKEMKKVNTAILISLGIK